MKSKRMIINWVNGHFEAHCPHLQGEKASWICPERIGNVDQWRGAFREALKTIKYDGQTVEIILAHPILIHQLVETPPAKGPTLQRYLEGQVDRVKTFQSKAAWAWEHGQNISGKSNKQIQTAIVHFLPEDIVRGLIKVVEENGFKLTHIAPVTEVIHHRLRNIESEGKQVILLVTTLGDSTMVMVSENSGRVYVVRMLKSHWNKQREQLATDLNRTMLYIHQTFGVHVSGVWMMGVESEHKTSLEALINAPVHLLETDLNDVYFCRNAAALSGKYINLISVSILREPKLRMIGRVAAVLTSILVLASLFIGSGVQYVLYSAGRQIKAVEPQLNLLREQKEKLTNIQKELDRKSLWTDDLYPTRGAYAPHWLLAYLGEAVPAEIQITQCVVERDGAIWKLKLDGVYHGIYRTNQVSTMESVVQELKQELETGLFHLKWTDVNKPDVVKQTGGETGLGHWMSSLSTVNNNPQSRNSTNSFRLEGVIQ
ncbi:MAG: hypothetical protein ACI84C_002409 [Flavobacteriales bacterium]|jgi:hypothetical protein